VKSKLSYILVVMILAATPRQLRAIKARPGPNKPTRGAYLRLAAETEAVLQKDILDKWFPAAVDNEHGGFYENFNTDWTRNGSTMDRSVVFQARLTWLAAQAAEQFPAQAARYREISRHGLEFLASKQWDQPRGGFFWTVDSAGCPIGDRAGEKPTYGIAFGMYAAATNYKVTKDSAALDLAKKTFAWLDQHGHDARYGGYIESFARDGRPMASTGRTGSDSIGTRCGGKSMNTSIHVLEALTALYAVWPDAAVRARTQEMFEIVRDKVYVEPGGLTLYFNADWSRLPGGDSFGHDIEAAYLLAEAAAALGIPDDARTWEHGQTLVDHALRFGYDKQRGGFYDSGTMNGEKLRAEKIWWVEAEGLNALLLMHERFGRKTPQYWNAFVQQWEFIFRYQLDHAHGGWYPTVSASGKPIGDSKSDAWTEGYHQGRALMNVTNTLRRLAAQRE
jgi:cellobiose epimerase